MNGSNKDIADFFFETGMLARFKRSGFDFLGTGTQNIASHSFRMAVMGYTMASMVDGADAQKCALICLFHDIAETRTGDINHFQRKYVVKDEKSALADILKYLPVKEQVAGFCDEFEAGNSIESIIALDADVLELIFTLKEELDNGNLQAGSWIKGAIKRLRTDIAKDIAQKALERKSYDWWECAEGKE